jgi:Protein of unknown function (DUF2934)
MELTDFTVGRHESCGLGWKIALTGEYKATLRSASYNAGAGGTTMTKASPEAHKPKSRLRRGKTQDLPSVAPEVAREPVHYCEDLSDRISQRAHAFYVDRGYRDGCALQDWLDAEREILSREQPS